MRIRVINSKDEINTLDQTDRIVHLAFRPSNKDILVMVQLCPNLKAIHIPKSYEKTISNSTYMLLDLKKITLLNGDVWEKKLDIIEYYEIKPHIIENIKRLKKEKKSEEEIISYLKKETHFSNEFIKLLL